MSRLLRFERSLSPLYKPFPHQREAFEAVKDKEFFGIFHEQGLGKTKIAIDLALYWLEKGNCDSIVFVTKKSLVRNWEEEVKNHTQHFPIVLTTNMKQNAEKFNSPAHLFICHYDLVKNHIHLFESFCNLRKVGMFLDESVAIKNPNTSMAKAFYKLIGKLKKRIIMTGTPVDNRPYDIWGQFYFLDQGKTLGKNFSEFKEVYDLTKKTDLNYLEKISYQKHLSNLNLKIRDHSLRETKHSAELNLPDKIFKRVEVSMDEHQKEIYEKVRKEFLVEVMKMGEFKIENIDFFILRLLRLIQVSTDPKIFDERYDSDPPKLLKVKEIINKIPNDEKIIIWTHFVKSAENLGHRLAEYNPSVITGNVDTEDRNTIINNFKNNPANRILISTVGASKEGLTLTVANHAIYYERNFKLSDYLQSQDRIHRISQTKESYIYNIFTKESVEEWLEALVIAKETSASYVQGDIDDKNFADRMKYDFNEILKNILEEKFDENGVF